MDLNTMSVNTYAKVERVRDRAGGVGARVGEEEGR